MTTDPATAAREAGPRWPALDGIRAVAVLAVLAYHAFPDLAPGGFLGVDLFFVLSGFLITTLLVEELRARGSISLRRFYLRRVLRLYPALVTVCAGVLVVGAASHQLGRVLPGALAALLYAGNVYLYTGHEAVLLDHTWTLAIEEHFYLVWPLLLLLASRVAGSRVAGSRAGFGRFAAVAAVAAAVAVVAVAFLLLVPWPAPVAGVRESYLRGVPIVWGALLALARQAHVGASGGAGHGIPARAARLLAAGGALALAGILLLAARPDALGMPVTGPWGLGGLLAVPLVAAGVLAAGGGLGRTLSWRPARWVGERAYGIYLVHFPLVSLLWHQGPQQVDLRLRMVVAAALSLLLAGAMYRWVERPFLRIKDRLH